MVDLSRVWRLIAEGTAENRLGCSAKVGGDDSSDSRVICVYTNDFRDQADVRRVAKELSQMGLEKHSKFGTLAYKSDAYTYLDIYGKNAEEYGLQPSIYTSRKLLASSNGRIKGSNPQMRQSTLEAFRR